MKYLKQTLKADNCLTFSRIGLFYGDTSLCSTASTFMKRHFENVSTTNEFISEATSGKYIHIFNNGNDCKSIPECLSEDLISLLQQPNNTLFVKSEDTILNCIINWITCDRENRQEPYLTRLLSFVLWERVSVAAISAFKEAFPEIAVGGK